MLGVPAEQNLLRKIYEMSSYENPSYSVAVIELRRQARMNMTRSVPRRIAGLAFLVELPNIQTGMYVRHLQGQSHSNGLTFDC